MHGSHAMIHVSCSLIPDVSGDSSFRHFSVPSQTVPSDNLYPNQYIKDPPRSGTLAAHCTLHASHFAKRIFPFPCSYSLTVFPNNLPNLSSPLLISPFFGSGAAGAGDPSSSNSAIRSFISCSLSAISVGFVRSLRS